MSSWASSCLSHHGSLDPHDDATGLSLCPSAFRRWPGLANSGTLRSLRFRSGHSSRRLSDSVTRVLQARTHCFARRRTRNSPSWGGRVWSRRCLNTLGKSRAAKSQCCGKQSETKKLSHERILNRQKIISHHGARDSTGRPVERSGSTWLGRVSCLSSRSIKPCFPSRLRGWEGYAGSPSTPGYFGLRCLMTPAATLIVISGHVRRDGYGRNYSNCDRSHSHGVTPVRVVMPWLLLLFN